MLSREVEDHELAFLARFGETAELPPKLNLAVSISSIPLASGTKHWSGIGGLLRILAALLMIEGTPAYQCMNISACPYARACSPPYLPRGLGLVVVGNDMYGYTVTHGIRCIHTVSIQNGPADPQLPLQLDGSEGSGAFESGSAYCRREFCSYLRPDSAFMVQELMLHSLLTHNFNGSEAGRETMTSTDRTPHAKNSPYLFTRAVGAVDKAGDPRTPTKEKSKVIADQQKEKS